MNNRCDVEFAPNQSSKFKRVFTILSYPNGISEFLVQVVGNLTSAIQRLFLNSIDKHPNPEIALVFIVEGWVALCCVNKINIVNDKCASAPKLTLARYSARRARAVNNRFDESCHVASEVQKIQRQRRCNHSLPLSERVPSEHREKGG